MPDHYFTKYLYPLATGRKFDDVLSQALNPTEPGAQRTMDIFPKPKQRDKRLHALTAMLASRRFGKNPTRIAGVLWELLNLPISEFDPEDLVANEVGVNLK